MQQWLHVAKRAESPGVAPSASPAPDPGRRRWLLLAHQLPATPSNLRVRTWRRLQDLGAIAVKQSVYVLPDSPESREDFEWLRVEIEGSGGEAIGFAPTAHACYSRIQHLDRRKRQWHP